MCQKYTSWFFQRLKVVPVRPPRPEHCWCLSLATTTGSTRTSPPLWGDALAACAPVGPWVCPACSLEWPPPGALGWRGQTADRSARCAPRCPPPIWRPSPPGPRRPSPLPSPRRHPRQEQRYPGTCNKKLLAGYGKKSSTFLVNLTENCSIAGDASGLRGAGQYRIIAYSWAASL